MRRLVYEVEQGAHGLIGVEEQLVAGEDLLAHGSAGGEHGARLGGERREQELVARLGRDLALE